MGKSGHEDFSVGGDTTLKGKKRCLVVRPVQPEAAHGGDEIVYRRSIEYLSRTMDIQICQLQSVSQGRKFVELFKGTPPELTRFLGRANLDRVTAAIDAYHPDVVCFLNEVTFPCLARAKLAGIKAVLVAQNVHSLVAASDPDIWARAFEPLAELFERKWYGDEFAQLVCISKADVGGLRRIGVKRKTIWVAPPGCPPAAANPDSGELLSEMVLTGSYAWWRKRRDLREFAKGDPLPIKIAAFDSVAREILGDQGQDPNLVEPDWTSGIRFGLITDRFLGGFKLKALEYVAKNCIILSACDISEEFEGLPHADMFVRTISSKQDAWRIMQEMRQVPDIVQRFRKFKDACLVEYGWERCLLPLGKAVEFALA